MAESVGNVLGFYRVPTRVIGMRVVVIVEWRVGRGLQAPQAQGYAAEGFDPTQERVGGRPMAYSLAFDSILLVSKLELGVRDAGEVSFVMQRCCGSGVRASADGEVDVLEEEGLSAGFLVRGKEVFTGAQEPEESDNDEVCDVDVERAPDGVLEVEGSWQVAEDGNVDRIGAFGWVVFVSHGFEERSVYGMELV